MIKLRADIAQQIVEQLGRLVEGPIAIVDETGFVIAADGPSFPRSPQRFALRVIRTGQLCEAIPEELPADQPPGLHYDQIFGLPLSYDGQAIGVILLSGERERVRTVARYVEVVAEVLVHQTAIVEQIPQQRELKDKFLYDVLHADRVDDPSLLIEEAAVLGMDLAAPRAAIALALVGPMEAGGSPNGNRARPMVAPEQKPWLMRSIARAFDPPQRVTAGYLGGGRVAVLLAVDPPEADRQLDEAARRLVQTLAESPVPSIRLGVGRYLPELTGLIRSYREAALALDAGIRLDFPGPIYTLADVSLGVFVSDADEATKMTLAGHLVDGLDDELIQTVRALLDADLSVSGAARQLSLHRHTLLYRLSKLKRTTGRDLRHFWDALPLALALTLLRMEQRRVMGDG